MLVMLDENGTVPTVGLGQEGENWGVFVLDDNETLRAFMGRYESPQLGFTVFGNDQEPVWQELGGPVEPDPPATTADQAYRAAMRSDLMNLVTAQESFYADNVTYTSDLAALDYSTSRGVTVEIISAGARGWYGQARHERADITCRVYIGDVPEPPSGVMEGQISCSGE